MAELKPYWRLEVSTVDHPVMLLLYHSGYPDADLGDSCLQGLTGFGGPIVVLTDQPCSPLSHPSPNHPNLATEIAQRLRYIHLEA